MFQFNKNPDGLPGTQKNYYYVLKQTADTTLQCLSEDNVNDILHWKFYFYFIIFAKCIAWSYKMNSLKRFSEVNNKQLPVSKHCQTGSVKSVSMD